ncbi:MAG: hypothetical protein LBM92_07210 [Opitutaceae bacterium]|nr:hypothetical protein [Opitutaceae bacterium]
MPNTATTLKTRIKNGETLAGLFVSELLSPNLGAFFDIAGYDFALFDLEHCPFTLRDLAGILPNFNGRRCRPMARVPAARREFIGPLLDLGVAGIMVPMVETPEQVREAVSLMKYPPAGRRGSHFGTPHTGFQMPDRDTFTRDANDNILLVVQIETAKGLASLDAILAEPGIDVAFAGNTDLALSMGLPNDLEKGPVCDAVRRILQTAKARGIPGGGNFTDPKFVGKFRDDGLRFVMLDSELGWFLEGLKLGRQRAGFPEVLKIQF